MYQALRLDRVQLESVAKQVIAAYDAKRLEEDRIAQVKKIDENGFILVPKKRGDHVPVHVKPKEKVLSNFYRFQMREEKKNRMCLDEFYFLMNWLNI
jgi:ribosomal RNA-processing protein 7